MTCNCCFTYDPLSALVTLEGDKITIDGIESRYLYGISPEMLGYTAPNRFGRFPCAAISSFIKN